ncbi:MAG: CBS domain-containing protein, partial [Dehalococcoidia bacterium]
FLDAAAVANYRQMIRREALRQYAVGDLMAPLTAAVAPVEGAPVVEVSEKASSVMEEMEEKGVHQSLVVQGGRVVGIISRDTFRGLKLS